jgi:hypothetical protein
MIPWSYSEDLLLAGGLMIFLDSTLNLRSGKKLYQKVSGYHALVLGILLVLGLMSAKEIVCMFLEAKMMKIIN